MAATVFEVESLLRRAADAETTAAMFEQLGKYEALPGGAKGPAYPVHGVLRCTIVLPL